MMAHSVTPHNDSMLSLFLQSVMSSPIRASTPDGRPDRIPGLTRSPIPIPGIMPDKGLISQSEIHPGCLQTPLRPYISAGEFMYDQIINELIFLKTNFQKPRQVLRLPRLNI